MGWRWLVTAGVCLAGLAVGACSQRYSTRLEATEPREVPHARVAEVPVRQAVPDRRVELERLPQPVAPRTAVHHADPHPRQPLPAKRFTGSRGTEKPYQVAGRWYRPAPDPNYDKVGVASWYGGDFHGRRTSNGEIYNMYAMTAAHKTLPMHSRLEVTNLANGRTVIVRVNDRGPFVAGRIVDLSHAAAQRLGFAGNGVTRVRVRNVTERYRVQRQRGYVGMLGRTNGQIAEAVPRGAHGDHGQGAASRLQPDRHYPR